MLPPTFYRRSALRVARDLLGAILVRRIGRSVLAGRIVEVEAYLGSTDPASHAYRGKSRRNETMFGEGGHLYVYFTYGMHHCANVVTGREGTGSAVLIRAIEPVAGIRRMSSNRGLPPVPPAGRAATGHRRPGGIDLRGRAVPPKMLTGGPARLCQALGISASDNGLPLQGPDIVILEGDPVPRSLIGRSGRIGISSGREKRWRFFIRGHPCLSRP